MSGPALPVPVHFWLPPGFAAPEADMDHAAAIAGLAADPRGTVGAWIIRTVVELRRRGVAVTLSGGLRDDAVNVADAFSFGRRQRLNTRFVLILRSDAHPPGLGQMVVHQNGLIPDGPDSLHIAHWPQPGLIPRDPARGERLERLTFKGEPFNLDARFRAPPVLRALAEMGITLDLPSADRAANARTWGDYAASDAVIAVRDLTHHDAAGKPASKLVNAWIAGVPALLGPEPAYRELRRGPLDYLEVATVADLFAALRRLRDDPALYRAMVANGRERARAFTPDRIADDWIALLSGPVAEAFGRWRRRPAVLRAAAVARALWAEPGRRRRHMAQVLDGPRILPPEPAGAAAATPDPTHR